MELFLFQRASFEKRSSFLKEGVYNFYLLKRNTEKQAKNTYFGKNWLINISCFGVKHTNLLIGCFSLELLPKGLSTGMSQKEAKSPLRRGGGLRPKHKYRDLILRKVICTNKGRKLWKLCD